MVNWRPPRVQSTCRRRYPAQFGGRALGPVRGRVFASGDERFERPSNPRHMSRLSEDRVIGYYTLVAGQVEYASAHERPAKGLARHPVPIMLLARTWESNPLERIVAKSDK